MGNEYSFLQEKIKDEAGSPKTLRKKITRMIVLGMFLGIFACFSFFASKPLVKEMLGQDKEEVSIPEDEEAEEESADSIEIAKEEAEETKQMKLLNSLQNAAKEVTPSIVTVSGQKEIEKDTEIKTTSGVIIADNGSEVLVLSRTLSDKDLKNMKITFSDGNEYSATVKMKDNNIGISICAVEKEIIKKDTWKLVQEATLGNSLLVKSGDPVILLGKNSDKGTLVSYGFVASSEERMEVADGYVDLLRVDVAGAAFDNGILLNQNGDVIGLVNAKTSENKSLVTVYAISDIKNEIERLSNGKGVPYIGIWGTVLPEELKENGLSEGIWIKEIDTDSPAMNAGIQCGDVITHIEETSVTSMEEYRRALLKENVKNEVTLSGFRKGADNEYVEMTFKVVIGKK